MVFLRIGIASADRLTQAACRIGLRDLGEFDFIELSEAAMGVRLPFDVLVLDLGMDLEHGLSCFGAARRHNQDLAIIVLGRDVPSDLAVELVKLGAGDFLSSPPDPNVLRRKVERLLTGQSRPTLALGMLETLKESPGSASQDNRRVSFRAQVPQDDVVWVELEDGEAVIRGTLVDISMASADGPAGMLLRISAQEAESKKIRDKMQGKGKFLRVFLPGRTKPAVVWGQLVRVLHIKGRAFFDVAFQFRTQAKDDATDLARFWVKCQTRRRDGDDEGLPIG